MQLLISDKKELKKDYGGVCFVFCFLLNTEIQNF